jgi:protein-disulfide isomerase
MAKKNKRASGGPPPASNQAPKPTTSAGAPPPSTQEKLIEQRSSRKAAAVRAEQQQRERRRNLMLIIGGIAIVAVIAIVLVSNSTRSTSAGVQGSSEDASLGPADAPVVLEDFSDFYCTHCRTFALERLPALEEKYVNDGLLRIEFKHFPLRDSSYEAHIAAQCAAVQKKFWEYGDKLFQDQGLKATYSTGDLKKYAADLGLDTAAFDACLDQKQTESLVRRDSAEGGAKQVNSTPTLFVNGVRISGAVPLSQFEQIIDAELQKKGITPPAS